ncbi:hypothetical protein [Streptomyces phage JXY1]|uniref:Uncharacterized protein n=1 Tax=Streptomyces phage JXY1 TaxID=2708562 RepID=A0A6C0RTE6_9CAUD|nr:hypothetical protein HWD10_gp30 [Streptomyces phage JXY1]QIA28847.1 hypothetical protein [Streptomyces phage JXY1]
MVRELHSRVPGCRGEGFRGPADAGQAPQAAEDKSIDEATKILDEGLGGVEEIDEDAPVKPWDKTSDETTTATTEKPWDLDDSDWDI